MFSKPLILCYLAAMRLLLIIGLALFVFSAAAGEKTPIQKQLESVVLSPAKRAQFDSLTKSLIDPYCNCIRFILKRSNGPKSKITAFALPLNDGDRVLLEAAFFHDMLIPIKTTGPKH